MNIFKVKRIAVNTSAQLVARLVSSALAFLATLLLARTLGGVYYGEYTKAMSYLTIFYVIVDLGINTVFLHRARGQVYRQFWDFFHLRNFGSLVLAVVAIASMWVLTRLNPGFTPVTLIATSFGALSILGYALFLNANALWQIRGRYDLSVIAQALGSVVTLGFLAIFYKNLSQQGVMGVVTAAVAMTGGTLVTGLSGMFSVLPFLPRFQLKIVIEYWLDLIQQSLPLGLTLIFNILYIRIGVLILATYRSSLDVGAYGLAFKFFEFALSLPTFFMNSYYPELLKETKISYIKNQLVTISLALGGLSFLVATVIWIGAPFLVLIKSDYITSVDLLRMLALTIPLFFLTSPFMFLFVVLDHSRQLLAIYIMATTGSLLLNLILIPLYGARATVVVLGVTELMVLVVGGKFLLKHVSD